MGIYNDYNWIADGSQQRIYFHRAQRHPRVDVVDQAADEHALTSDAESKGNIVAQKSEIADEFSVSERTVDEHW